MMVKTLFKFQRNRQFVKLLPACLLSTVFHPSLTQQQRSTVSGKNSIFLMLRGSFRGRCFMRLWLVWCLNESVGIITGIIISMYIDGGYQGWCPDHGMLIPNANMYFGQHHYLYRPCHIIISHRPHA